MPTKSDESYAYRMGKDSVVNGANITNCHFTLFTSKELTEAWERGVKDADKK